MLRKTDSRKGSCRNWILGLIMIGLLWGGCFIAAAENGKAGVDGDAAELSKALDLFYQARLMFYNSEADLKQVGAVIGNCKKVLNSMSDGFSKYYWLATAYFLEAETAEVANNKAAALQCFQDCETAVQKAGSYRKKSGTALRLLADTYMRQTVYKNFFYSFSYGPKALKLLNEAVSLDKQDYTSYNSLAVYYINAPEIGGGNIQKGIATLEKALASKDRFDNFISYMWLGHGYRKQKQNAEAAVYYQKALQIYPQNKAIIKALQDVQS